MRVTSPVSGIAAYAAYVPGPRISTEECTGAWGKFSARGIKERAVPDSDEDSMTMAVEAARSCLAHPGVATGMGDIEFVSTASSSYPYEVKFHPAMLIEALSLNPAARATQFGVSTKAGGEALLSALDWVCSSSHGISECPSRPLAALTVMGDAPRADTSSEADHRMGAGAAAFLVSTEPCPVIARFEGASSYSVETMGSWFRPAGSPNLTDIGVPGYSESLMIEVMGEAVRGLLNRLNCSPADYTHVVFHQPDAVLPNRAAKTLGFTADQIAKGLTVSLIGDAGVSSPFLGLAAVLDQAVGGERLLVVTYGAGSGADAMSFVVTDQIASMRQSPSLLKGLSRGQKIDYIQYLRLRGSL